MRWINDWILLVIVLAYCDERDDASKFQRGALVKIGSDGKLVALCTDVEKLSGSMRQLIQLLFCMVASR